MSPGTETVPHFLDEPKSLACVHCGLCLGACPTYLETGNENESPRGRIYLMRALQAGRVPLDDASVEHIDLCLGCRACEVACPSGVQYGALLEQTRDFIESRYQRSHYQTFLRRFVIEKIFPVPWRMKLALVPARFAKTLKLDRILPKKLREPLDLIPDRVSSRPVPEISGATVTPAKGSVGFISGCVMSVMFGDTNRSSIQLLNALGYDVVTPSEQICCGALFAHGGNMEKAREHAARNVKAFAEYKLDAIIINAAGCGSTLKEYGHLLEGGTGESAGKQFAAKVFDLTEFLVSNGFLKDGYKTVPYRLTYHDACHLAHPQRITKQPRDLVKMVAGGNYVELAEADICCGSAGSYNLTEPEMAERLQSRKIRNIAATGADVVVTTNPGCILQIRSGIEKAAGKKIRVMHIADFLAESLPLDQVRLG
jgi:glycolate oxidase iron-sulfur subunit